MPAPLLINGLDLQQGIPRSSFFSCREISPCVQVFKLLLLECCRWHLPHWLGQASQKFQGQSYELQGQISRRVEAGVQLVYLRSARVAGPLAETTMALH